MRIPVSFVFLALVFGEIAGFVLVGQALGLLPTLGLVLLGMAGGLFLLRIQGLQTLMRARAETEAGRAPARPLAEGAIRALAAVLIIIPGFITDLVGLALLVPFVREALFRALKGRFAVANVAPGPRGPVTVDLDEGEYSASQHPRPHPDSPWRLDRKS